MAVVVKYIEARPERMHEDFGLLAIEALTGARRAGPVLFINLDRTGFNPPWKTATAHRIADGRWKKGPDH
jgi:hypothetical protein